MEHMAGIGRSLERIGVGVRMIELVGALMQDGQENPLVLDQLVESLRVVDQASERVQNAWPFFAMRLAAILGLSPAFRRSDVDGLAGENGWLRLDRGSVEAVRPAGVQSVRASRQALRAFAVCTRATPEVVLRMNMSAAVLTEVNALVESYIQYHVEDAFPHRTAKVLGQIGA